MSPSRTPHLRHQSAMVTLSRVSLPGKAPEAAPDMRILSHIHGNQLQKTPIVPRFPDLANVNPSGITVLGYQSKRGKR
jgi:hypothetical protein